ncbi:MULTISPECIES: peptide ABC transporter permease [unclassified Bosea (in: a-proteobacteria)]|uniref:peptide ABC transporter permease n=2 Tax=unclassified Bosea (in: a-proteobacteria) TaxID=2653178 RepID=UPI00125F0575|nr:MULTISPECIES: peptide ABC transporter permease [unclassified Bosea (in: a-proteobacteria)]
MPMIRPNAQTPLDPATDAALLLRRIGFATLALALPLASLVSRRAAVVLVPIGVILLSIAALIEAPRWFAGNIRAAIFSRAGVTLWALVGWAVLSLIWSPYTGSATEKAANLFLAVALGFAGAAALPERMRASNLNLAALGAGAAAIFALGLLLTEALGPVDSRAADAAGSVERGISVVLIMSWPALAWLLSRERGLTALGLALVVGLLALSRIEDGEAMAMLCGAIAFGAVSANRIVGARLMGGIMAGLMLLAPLLPFLLLPFFRLSPAVFSTVGVGLDIWADIISSRPVQLITGHGLDTVLRGRTTGALPLEVPTTILFETWYELGLVGAATAALCLYFAVSAAGRMPGALAAGGVAAYVTAFALAALGFASFQTWWLMTLTAVALLFTAIARGQYRTERPVAPLGRRPKAPNVPIGE